MLFMAAPHRGVEFNQQRAAVISSSHSGAVVHGQGMVRAICCFVAAPAVVRGGYPAACNRDQQQPCWYRASFTARGMQPRSAAVTLVLSFLLGTVRATCCLSQLPRWRVEVGQRRAAAIRAVVLVPCVIQGTVRALCCSQQPHSGGVELSQQWAAAISSSHSGAVVYGQGMV